MVEIDQTIVEEAITKVLKEIKETLEADVIINSDCSPGIFFKSQVLVTAIGRVANALDISIPDSCYIFYDKRVQKQLTIKEAALKLINEAKNGN